MRLTERNGSSTLTAKMTLSCRREYRNNDLIAPQMPTVVEPKPHNAPAQLCREPKMSCSPLPLLRSHSATFAF
jgi:hypothetical protein